MKKCFIAGGVSYDTIIYLEEFFEAHPQTIFAKKSEEMIGGTGAGKALNLARLGFDTVFHTMLGHDRVGSIIREYFYNQPLVFVTEDDEKTETHTNIMNNQGDRISIFTNYFTFQPQVNYLQCEKIITECDYVVLNIINYVRNLIPLAKKHKKEIWCDIHDYDGKNEYHKEFIYAADYVFMSSDSIKDYKRFMEKLIKSGKKLVVCTHGKNGSCALDMDGRYFFEPVINSYQRVNTNGAGDSFFAGFLYAFDKGYFLQKALRYGTIAGGLCVESCELYNPLLSCDLIESEYKKYYEGN